MLDYLRANRLDSYSTQEQSIILPLLLQSIRLNTPQNGLKSSFDCHHFYSTQTYRANCFPLTAVDFNGIGRRGASRGTCILLSRILIIRLSSSLPLFLCNHAPFSFIQPKSSFILIHFGSSFSSLYRITLVLYSILLEGFVLSPSFSLLTMLVSTFLRFPINSTIPILSLNGFGGVWIS